MNVWLVAATILLAGIVPCGWVCIRGSRTDALVIALVLAIAGSVVTTATARAIRLRDRGSLEATPGERNRAPER